LVEGDEVIFSLCTVTIMWCRNRVEADK
jgi:hypothetical protein